MKSLILAAAAFALVAVGPAQSTVLTFDNTSTGDPMGYGGFSWANFGVLDPASSSFFTNSGYSAGTVSGSQVGYAAPGIGNPAVISRATKFTLVSGYFTGAWSDDMLLTAVGYIGDTAVFDQAITLSATVPTLFAFNSSVVDRVEFSTFGGTQHFGYDGSGNQFVLDNLVFASAVPESATWAMFIGGFGVVGAGMRRRQRLSVRFS